MGSAASTDRAERRRRDRPLGQGDASTAGPLVTIPEDTEAADVTRRGCKVSPEPKEGGEPAAAQPGSPSFRIYCQDTSRVDALVAASDAADDRDELARATEASLAIRNNDLAGGSDELSKSKEQSGWMKFRGLALVDALYSLIVCRSKAASAHNPPHPHPPPAAVVAAKPDQPHVVLPPRPAPPRPFF
ncbi:uncharacterized protein [Lolium perenne]|uniref:uncharacterized protein n=1 Tax=Lolium perenne TaxID=4522 RepID=UPI0021EAC806|nr:uncharacterized protein LOC127345448 [Lolium perenne]